MEEHLKLGLIGRNISYSFSKNYFEQKFSALKLANLSYSIFDLKEISEVEEIFNIENLRGFNVTIPYKEQILPFLNEISPEAEKIGAVNTVLIKNGKKIGYNTDAFGFEDTLFSHKNSKQKSALVLGNGGAAKAVKYVLEKHGIPYQSVFRKGDVNFENLPKEQVKNHLIIIQCTPVGTFPNVSDCVEFPFEALSAEHLVIDLIYNPAQTEFLKKAAAQKATTVNGENMLKKQAEKAWEIWNI
ncbi:shikimate dehydrogenase [Chryseobacterium sp. H3056]|uniref:Shikimate dehydrogenase n=1 Tax=Kaistella daneshvariae TaxID=2487074 RepID=A0A3N0WYB2_9FLAO|nr:shikimate dehydrogenase [Kaistella daneshvariae]ROI10108.1 shikimate dehydrogenase [Kaistella daneshvariae]